MTATRADLACRFCRHPIDQHNNIEGNPVIEAVLDHIREGEQ